MDCIYCGKDNDTWLIRSSRVHRMVLGYVCKECRPKLEKGTWAYAETIPKRYRMMEAYEKLFKRKKRG